MPRPVHLTGRGVVMLFMAAVFVAVGIGGGIAFHIDARNTAAELRRMEAEGAETAGVVDRAWRTGGKTPRDMIRYHFSSGGQTYSKDDSISHSHWIEMAPGKEIAIRYLPSDPAVSFPAADPPKPTPLGISVLFGAIFVLLAGVFFWMVRSARALLEDGKPAPAVVIANRWSASRRGSRNQVVYEFRLREGGAYQGKANRSPIPEGTTICVLYNPENPGRNAPYPFQLVKVSEY